MITNEPGKKAAPDFRLDVKLRDVLVNSSEIRVCRSQSILSTQTRGGKTIALITISRPGGPGKAWEHPISNIGSCQVSFNP